MEIRYVCSLTPPSSHSPHPHLPPPSSFPNLLVCVLVSHSSSSEEEEFDVFGERLFTCGLCTKEITGTRYPVDIDWDAQMLCNPYCKKCYDESQVNLDLMEATPKALEKGKRSRSK